MKKFTIFSICFLALFFSATGIFAQEGLTVSEAGSVGSSVQFYQAVTVAQAKALPDNSRILLTGNLVNSPRRDYYTFRDTSGEILVEIEKKYWGGISITADDQVQIFGELDKDRKGRIEVDVAIVRKKIP